MTWTLAARAANALDDLAKLVFGVRLPVAKRDESNPLSREGFAALLHKLSLSMLYGVAPAEEAALLRVIKGLDVDWSQLSEQQRDKAIARAMGALAGVPAIVGPKIGDVLLAEGKTLVEQTKRAARDKYSLRIDPTFDAVDQVVIHHAATSQAFYIRNEYGKRVDVFSELARQVVADGLEQGLDRYQIGAALKGALEGTSADRSEAYFRMIASVFAARSRTYATVASFADAGIEEAEWSSVLDEVTSDVCRFMDGKVISVGSIVDAFHRVSAAPNPEDVREIQPFANVGRDDDGQYLYFKRAGERVQIARVEESGVGVRDAKGSYSNALSGKDLVATGVTPPAHPHCFPPGTLVVTPGGEVPIERLRVGDVVIGGLTGRPRSVVERHERQHGHELVVVGLPGGSFRLTANHPMLTTRGWVEAGALQVGDKLCRHLGQVRVAHSDPLTGPSDHQPTEADKVSVLSLIDLEFSRRAVPVTGVDLDGDSCIREGEVDVKHVNRVFRRRVHALGCKGCREGRLNRAWGLPRFPLGLVAFGLQRPLLPLERSMRSVGEGLPLLRSRPTHPNEHRFGPVSVLQTGPGHRSRNRTACTTKGPGDALYGETFVEVHPSHGLDVQHGARGPRLDTFGLHGTEDHASTTAELNRDLRASQSRQVQAGDFFGVDGHATILGTPCATVDVFSVHRVPYDGKVHNIGVDVEEAYVLASGVVAHNCRSVLVPASSSRSQTQVPAPIQPSVAPIGLKPEKPQQVPFVFTQLPSDLAQQVRQPGTRLVDTETLPEMTPEEQAIANAVAKLKTLPATEQFAGHLAVAHGLPAVPDGQPNPYYTDEAEAKFKTAAKLKPKAVKIADVVLPIDDLMASEVEHAIHVKDPALVLVKSGGKYYANVHGSNFVVAAHLKGDETIQAKVIDLDKKKPAKKPKVAPAPAPAAPAPKPPVTADVILGTKTGGAKGSNDGGFYTGKDGVERYVKFYDDPAQAHCEHLANSLYNDLGYGAPESVLFEHNGKTAYASVLFKGGKTLADAGLTTERAKKVMDGFVADVLTANWDAVGTGLDNAMQLPDGRVVRIDNGGTFLMRAKEGRKPEGLLNAISEWDVFFSSKNPYYQKVANTAGVSGPEDMRASVVEGIKKTVALRDSAGGWAAYLKAKTPNAPAKDAQRIVDMLDARTALLERKLAELTAPPKPAPKPGEARFIGKQYSTVLPKPGLRLEDLPESSVIADNYEKLPRHSSSGKMPSGESRAAFIQRAEAAIAGISAASKSAIKNFTGNGYGGIRASEERGEPGHDSQAIQKAFEVATPEPGTVYRGMNGLSRDVLEAYMKGHAFTLGRNSRGATSSTSWMIDVSIDSFMGGPRDGYGEDHKILFVLNQKTGIPIQTISSAKESYEHEILMKRDARFRVTGLSRAAGTKRILVIEAEEIVEDTNDATTPGGGAKKKGGKNP